MNDGPDVAAAADTVDAVDAATDAATDAAPDLPPDVAPDVAPDVPVDVALDVSTCVCGNGKCDLGCGETPSTCAVDCSTCGDGLCTPGEGPISCPTDCCGGCGDGICKGYDCGENPTTCQADCGSACGNAKCDKGESPSTCPADCKKQACGNGVCEPEDGGPEGCPQDCGVACGDCKCDKGENFVNCPVDCGFCGDGVCSNCTTLGETKDTCSQDCKADACKGFDVSKCDDGISCTKDVCGSNGACLNLIRVNACADGNACTDDTCDLGKGCVNSQTNCDDGEACTADSCDPTTGCVHTATGAPCDDGDPCTKDEVCTKSGCKASTPKGCDDGEVCTIDKCEGTLCVHLPATATCDDANVCTINDFCKAGACKGGGPLNCDDGDDCTVDFCQNGCQHAANTGKCNDGNVCTNDFCDSLTGCIYLANAATCTDGEACTIGDHCADTGCVPGAEKPCDDGIACTKDYCDGGVCKSEAGSGGCDDSNPCTDDACIAGNGCAHTANVNTCDDGDGCTVKDFCKDTVCQPGTPKDCSDGTTCTNDDCIKSACVHTAVSGSCDDKNACTVNDVCQSGACIGGAAVTCDDGNDCTADSCDPANGCATSLVTNGTPCAIGLCEFGVCELQCPVGTRKINLDDGGVKKSVCPFTYPIWGTRQLSPTSYTDKGDGTIADAQTGLFWQKTANPTAGSWDLAVADCDALVLGGKTDWRLPTLAELESLVDYGSTSQTIDAANFAGPSAAYWTAERLVIPYGANAWGVNFKTGGFDYVDAGNSRNHRCVRGGRPASAALTQRFRQNGNETVTDMATQLTWLQPVSSTTLLTGAAISYCQGLTVAGGKWRAPNIRELISLHDVNSPNAWMDATAFPDTLAAAYWSGTYVAGSTSSAWYVEQGNGSASAITGTSTGYLTRCVRDTGGCVVAADCDDLNPCTVESCDPAGSCSHTLVADSTVCGGSGVCQSGACACPDDTTAVNVDSDVVCAFDYPVWGSRPLSPTTLMNNNNGTSTDTQTGLTWLTDQDGTLYSWVGARDYCAGLTTAGKTDWRLPTVAELESVVDYTMHNNSLASPLHIPTSLLTPWSALAAPGGKHWAVEYYWGVSGPASGWQNVRCVRGKPPVQPYASRFVINGDGTVKDQGTGLLWQQDASAPPMTQAAAGTYCTGLTLAGGGWRLPNIREAASLLRHVDVNATMLIDQKAFPATLTEWFWTSTLRHGSTVDAWQVNFSFPPGGDYFDATTDSVRVRCVK